LDGSRHFILFFFCIHFPVIGWRDVRNEFNWRLSLIERDAQSWHVWKARRASNCCWIAYCRCWIVHVVLFECQPTKVNGVPSSRPKVIENSRRDVRAPSFPSHLALYNLIYIIIPWQDSAGSFVRRLFVRFFCVLGSLTAKSPIHCMYLCSTSHKRYTTPGKKKERKPSFLCVCPYVNVGKGM
jgi:hypothetical protein